MGSGGPDTLCVYASCRAEQSSAEQSSAVCSAAQCAVQRNVQCSAVQCSAVQCSAVQCSGVQRREIGGQGCVICNNVTRTADEDKAAFDDVLLVEAAQCLAEREAICGHQRCNVWRALARPL